MTILAIETSSPQASLAVWDSTNRKTIWQDSFITERRHNAKIFDALQQAIDLSVQPWDLIAIGIGPGSYGGVRVGIAAANGISIAKNIVTTGISSLEAYSEEADYLVVGDARRNSYYLAEVKQHQLTGEPELLDKKALSKQIASSDSPIFTMDKSVADQYQSIQHQYPSAERLAIRASQLDAPTTLQVIEPHYLRPPFITQAKKKPVPGFG